MLTVAMLSTAGAVRPNNEDSLLWDSELGLLAVADGMGGHNAGEVASRLAIEALHRFLRASTSAGAVHWPFGTDSSVAPAVNRLKTAVRLANREVFQTSEERLECAGMGTTLTAALVDGAHVLFSNVGDSRLYAYPRGARFGQKTRDDSLAGMLADAPGVDRSMLDDSPMKHLLTNAVGKSPDLDVEIAEMTLDEDGLLLLCSDGMHGVVPDEVMQAVLDRESDLQRAVEHLVQEALDSGSRDNISVILARYSKA